MRFLADENVPRGSINLLRSRGVDVLSASETARGSSDSELLEWSIRESSILLTFDRDFGALVFRSNRPTACGIILFRMIPAHSEEPAEILLTLIEQPEMVLENRFTVIERDRVRQRPIR